MTPIKHLFNNVLEMKSNKNNLKQGDIFLNNKKRFMGFNKIVEGFNKQECSIPDTSSGNGKRYDITQMKDESTTTQFKVTGIKCADGYKGTAIVTVCDGVGQPIKLTGCEPTLSTKIKQKSYEIKINEDQLSKSISDEQLNYNGKNHYNVIDKKGNTYYVNLDGQYYKYQNAAGESTFNPSHVDFSNTCPKTAPKFIKNTPYIVEGDIDPISLSSGNNECIKYKNEDLNKLYSYIMKLEKEIKDLTEKNSRESESADTTEAVFKRNRAAILLSHKINKYNELVEQSKKITNDIKSFDTSRGDFLKSITALQIQYGVVGLTSIALVYLTIKMMSNNES